MGYCNDDTYTSFEFDNIDNYESLVEAKPSIEKTDNDDLIFGCSDNSVDTFLIDRLLLNMKDSHKKEYLNQLGNNLKSLILARYNRMFMLGMFNSDAHYDIESNVIDVSKMQWHEINGGLLKELYLMSASYRDYDHNMMYCGFYRKDGSGMEIGSALTNGFAQYLAEENSPCESRNYQFERNIVVIFKKLFGNYMDKLYFNANLSDLISEMELFIDRKDAIELIKDLDIIEKFKKVNRDDFKTFAIFETALNRVIGLISKLCLSKYCIVNNVRLDEQQILEVMSSIKPLLSSYEIDLIYKNTGMPRYDIDQIVLDSVKNSFVNKNRHQ